MSLDHPRSRRCSASTTVVYPTSVRSSCSVGHAVEQRWLIAFDVVCWVLICATLQPTLPAWRRFWEGRSCSRLVDARDRLLTCQCYIQLNPAGPARCYGQRITIGQASRAIGYSLSASLKVPIEIKVSCFRKGWMTSLLRPTRYVSLMRNYYSELQLSCVDRLN